MYSAHLMGINSDARFESRVQHTGNKQVYRTGHVCVAPYTIQGITKEWCKVIYTIHHHKTTLLAKKTNTLNFSLSTLRSLLFKLQ